MFNPGDRVYVLSQYKEWQGSATVTGLGTLVGYLVRMDDGRDFVAYADELYTLH